MPPAEHVAHLLGLDIAVDARIDRQRDHRTTGQVIATTQHASPEVNEPVDDRVGTVGAADQLNDVLAGNRSLVP